MTITLLSQERGAVRVASDTLRRLSSPGADHVTMVTLTSGDVLTVAELPMRILERAGLRRENGPFISVDVEDDTGVEYLHGDWIAVMSKVREDDDGVDPTRLDLADGQSLVVTESICTLDARLSLSGFTVIDIDLPTTKRPAALLPAAVTGAAPDEDGLVAITLKGGATVLIRDPDRSVTARILEAAPPMSAHPAEDAADARAPGMR